MGHIGYALSSGDAFLSSPSVSYKSVAIVNAGREEGTRESEGGDAERKLVSEWYKVPRWVAGYSAGT